jgi:hypothetical protein
MNKKIQELVEQAGFLNKEEESIEYFAELIVQECIDTIKNTPSNKHSAYTTHDLGTVESTIERCIKSIKEKFDIKK